MPITYAGVPLTLATPEIQGVVDSLFTPEMIWPTRPSATRAIQHGFPVDLDWAPPDLTLNLLRWPCRVFPGFGTYLAVVDEDTWQEIRTAVFNSGARWEYDGDGTNTDTLPWSFAPLILSATDSETGTSQSVVAYMKVTQCWRLNRLASPARLLVLHDVRYEIGNRAVGGFGSVPARKSWANVLSLLYPTALKANYALVVSTANIPTATYLTSAESALALSLPGPRWYKLQAELLALTQVLAASTRTVATLTPIHRMTFSRALKGYFDPETSPPSNALVGRPPNPGYPPTEFSHYELVQGNANSEPFPRLLGGGNAPASTGANPFWLTSGSRVVDTHFGNVGGVYAGIVAAPSYENLAEVSWLYNSETCVTNLVPLVAPL